MMPFSGSTATFGRFLRLPARLLQARHVFRNLLAEAGDGGAAAQDQYENRLVACR
jgi:hypothetical protein